MNGELLVQIGGPLVGAGLGVVFVARGRNVRLAALIAAGVGTAAVLVHLLPDGHRGTLLAAALVAGALLVAGAVGLRRWPWAFAYLALAAAPARIPVAVGDTEANLLVPLYAIVGAGALALAWSLLRDPPRPHELGPLRWPLALTVAWLGISAAWADDQREAAIDVLFFIAPFAVLALLIARLPWHRAPLRWLVGQLLAMAMVFAGVGIYQWLAREVFWNPKVEIGNVFQSFFRVNSLFWDPSIYGRFLVIAILAGLTLLVTWRKPNGVYWGAAVIVMLWVGLLFSFSQSSFAALIACASLLALLAWRWRAAVALALVAAVLVPVVAFAPPFERARSALVGDGESSFDRATGGRFEQVKSGAAIARDNPVLGVGLGGYLDAFAEENGLVRAPARAALHATPVTVAAENGFVGLVFYIGLVVSTLLAAFRIVAVPPIVRDVAWIGGLAFAAITVHSFFYNAFFEDPMMWGALGLIALALSQQTASEQTGKT